MDGFSEPTRRWFLNAFGGPTEVQKRGFSVIQTGAHALLLAPTGSGKTLAAFLVAIDRLMAERQGERTPGTRVLYISPLKALAYDVERNLRTPLLGIGAELAHISGAAAGLSSAAAGLSSAAAGLSSAAAGLSSAAAGLPRVDIRTGDTSAKARRQQLKHPGEILVTTPESLYLLLGSRAREHLRSVHTVIVDEVHALMPSKRGAHLALSLERLSALTEREPQRIGLSATARPAEEVGRFLAGDRPVQLVDGSRPPRLDLCLHVPADDMTQPLPAPEPGAHPPEPADNAERGMWAVIHPKLLELIRAHRTTILFVNSRGLCERLCRRLNELAGEPLLRAHHGSVSHAERASIEAQLKAGDIAGIVATSSLELGVDMSAVDLVVMVESPGSVASGLQRVGRAGHGVGQTSRGRIFPKHRADLLEATVVGQRMLAGEIEAIRMPQNALDVLSQQIVAMVAVEPQAPGQLFACVRRSAPYRDLPESAFVAVLDMLSGRYPSHRFADLRARIVWDRAADRLTPQRGANMLALINGGTIPDRGTFPVHLGEGGPRVGELDEEMVYETVVGEVITLGASSWRVEDITRDRVIVSPAPGEVGKLPFWHGQRPGRPLELGRALGAFTRALAEREPEEAVAWLLARYPVDAQAARNLVDYIGAQKTAIGVVPTDRRIVVECFFDELGDYRVCILSPFGLRVHAPWALCLEASLSRAGGFEVQSVYNDDGIALRLSEAGGPPALRELLPDPDALDDLLVDQLSRSSLFAGLFRENATRALLMPRRHPAARRPLWLQRRKAAELLGVALQHPSFPIVIETYRACMQDVFDLDALREVLGDVRAGRIEAERVQSAAASPFARSLMLQYAAAFMYDGDAPRAERRAQALSLDRELLRTLLGHASLRELLDAEVIGEVTAELQCLTGYGRARDAEGVVDLLRRLGDLSPAEVAARCDGPPPLDALRSGQRVWSVAIAGEERLIAIEDAALYAATLGAPLPDWLPDSLRPPPQDAAAALVGRFGATRGPFVAREFAHRYGLPHAAAAALLEPVVAQGQLLRGEFLPGGSEPELCDADVLRRLKRATLAKLRKQAAPVEALSLASFLPAWHGIVPVTLDASDERSRSAGEGAAAALSRLQRVLAQLEGLALPLADLEQVLLPARVPGFEPRLLDDLCAMGSLVWIGAGEGRVALYRRARVAELRLAPVVPEDLSALERALLSELERSGASFASPLCEAAGVELPEGLAALRRLGERGLVTNDSFAPLRYAGRSKSKSPRVQVRALLKAAGGRWSRVQDLHARTIRQTERAHHNVLALLDRHGVVSREVSQLEPQEGGFSATYRVLQAMEQAGQVRRGYFVRDLGGAQFARPEAVERLRAAAEGQAASPLWVLSAVDPACPFGWLLPWPALSQPAHAALLRRTAGASVVIVEGQPALYLARGGRHLLSFADLPAGALSTALGVLRAYLRGIHNRARKRIELIDGQPAGRSPLTPMLLQANFAQTYGGLEA